MLNVEELREISSGDIDFAPFIIQKYIEKDHEIRVCFFCKSMYAYRQSPFDKKENVDWRSIIKESKFEEVDIDTDLQDAIWRMIEITGVDFGTIDLAVSSRNEIFFLDFNPSGSFLYIERSNPELCILKKFTSAIAKKIGIEITHDQIRYIDFVRENQFEYATPASCTTSVDSFSVQKTIDISNIAKYNDQQE